MTLKNHLLQLYKTVYSKFPIKFEYISELENLIRNCKTILDVGCGSNSPLKHFPKQFYCIGVDKFEPWLKSSKNKKIHDKYIQLDVLKINQEFEENSFDCVVALDLIEHLTKEEGNLLLKRIEKIAKKKIIIFTTNGFVPQGVYDNNPWDVHKSGWTVNEMKKRGFKVIGINGWKFLKGEYGLLKFKPRFFWFGIAHLTQLFVRNYPAKAFQILCVKEK